MTLRAVLLGLTLGLFVSGFTLFHDNVIQGTWFINNHLPVSVFGTIVLLTLAANPLLRWLGARLPLNVTEIAVVAAIGLASCGWPSFGYYQAFVPITATPMHWAQSQPGWQANQVMSYVPGASDELGHGHVQDWSALSAALLTGEGENDATLASQVWRQLRPHEQQLARATAGASTASERAAVTLLSGLNRVIREARLVPPPDLQNASFPAAVKDLLNETAPADMTARQRARVNRWLLVKGFADQLLPPPAGKGVLLTGSDGQAGTMLIHGYDAADGSILSRIPWADWWPVLRLWGGLGVMMGLATLCLAIVVHPQWSRRELLSYPLAQFVTELSRRVPGRAFPEIATHRLFWGGLGSVVVLHGVNGLAQWYPPLSSLAVPLNLDLRPLRELFPNAGRVPGIHPFLAAHLHLSVVAFAFFLNAKIAFSVGIAPLVYAAIGGMLLRSGIAIEQPYMGAGNTNLFRFGAYIGMAAIIAYVGRHYYSQVAMNIVGFRRADTVPRYAVWAGRGLVACVVLSVVILRGAGLDWILASLFVLILLLMFLVLSRIVSETGLFFVQPWWMPVAMLTAMFGIEAIGPTSYIILAMGSVILAGDPRTALMPYLSTGLRVFDRAQPPGSPLRISGPLFVMVVAGFFVAGLATFAIVHERGVAVLDAWSTDHLPTMPFDELSAHLAQMRSHLTLAQATAEDGLTSLSQIELSGAAYGWIGTGILAVALCSIARLRLPWWPIHPALFLILGTMPAARLGLSFLLGWLIKLAVVQLGGSQAYRIMLPLMVGIIAGELLAAVGWTTVGVAYYLNTGLLPTSYRVYP